MVGRPVELRSIEERRAGRATAMDAYERLLGDAMLGDATLFARQDVVEAAWAIVDPVIHGPSPMYQYEPGTWGPKEADELVEERGRLEYEVGQGSVESILIRSLSQLARWC